MYCFHKRLIFHPVNRAFNTSLEKLHCDDSYNANNSGAQAIEEAGEKLYRREQQLAMALLR